jgi:hypothetical protein
LGSAEPASVDSGISLTINGLLEHAVHIQDNEDKDDSRKSSKDLRVRLAGDRSDETKTQHEIIHEDRAHLFLFFSLCDFTDHKDEDGASTEPFKVTSNIDGNSTTSEDGGGDTKGKNSVRAHGNKVDTKEDKGQLFLFKISGASIAKPREGASKGKGRSWTIRTFLNKI